MNTDSLKAFKAYLVDRHTVYEDDMSLNDLVSLLIHKKLIFPVYVFAEGKQLSYNVWKELESPESCEVYLKQACNYVLTGWNNVTEDFHGKPVVSDK